MHSLERLIVIIVLLGASASTLGQPLQIVDNLPGTFIDISLTGGTPLNLLNDDEILLGTTVGNVVFPSGGMIVANNGGLAFRNPADINLAPLNEPIPSNNAFGGGQAAMAFWDDIDDKVGNVFFAPLISTPIHGNGMIIQWNNRNFFGASPLETATFQIQIFENGGPDGIVAQYLFQDIEQPRPGGGISATIGYQDGGAGFGDVQWSFDTSGAVANGTVLSLVIPEPGTLTLLALGGLFVLRRQRSSKT
ncbi:MAG: PEP-CTERM sorting domain-containing protein [Phycisphaerae bacterium]